MSQDPLYASYPVFRGFTTASSIDRELAAKQLE